MARDLVDLCARLDRARFSPRIIVLGSAAVLDEELRALGIPIEYFNCRGSAYSVRGVVALFRIARLLRAERVRVVHGSHYQSALFAALAARLTGARSIANRIDLGFCVRGGGMRGLVNFTNLLSNVIVANCDTVRHSVASQERWAERKLKVIYNGCDTQRLRSSLSLAGRAELGLPPDGEIILNVANLHPHKRQEWLLEAAPKVLAEFPEARFVFVGKDMGYLPFLQNLVGRLGIERSVIFTGVRTDVPNFLRVATVGTLTSETEACSNALLEYSASGLPVVATDVGGNCEIVLEGRSGYLVPPGQAGPLAERLIELLKDPARAARMGQAGQTHVEQRFSLNRAVEQYEKLFENLAEGI